MGASPASFAATATTTMGVTAVVLSTCVAVATPVVFGNYSLTAVDANGLITVTCTPDVLSYNVGLDAGTGSGATTSSRKLTSLTSTDTMSYGLFRDASRTQNWGEAAGDMQPSSAATTSLGAIKTFSVFGRLGGSQTGAIGAYLDTIQVTVNY